MKLINKIYKAVALILILSFSSCEASTHYESPGLSINEVRRVIKAASPGDTVILPEGTATWDSQLVITKGIKLIGAGAGKTIITGNYRAPNMGNPSDPANYLIVFEPSLESATANEPFRLSGFTFDCSGLSIWLTLRNNRLTKMNQIRVDHNSVRNVLPRRGILVQGTVYGVIDNNTFNFDTIRFYGIGRDAWRNHTFDFGTEDNIYVEDNVWTSAGTMVSSGGGSRYCIRHNEITNISNASVVPCFDAHGNQSNGIFALMGVEIYGNEIKQMNNRGLRILDQRGGKGLVYDNNVITTGWVDSRVTEEVHDDTTPPAVNLISGQPQHVSDSYYWSNTKDGQKLPENENPHLGATIDYGAPKGVVPQRNRDYWNEILLFDGTSGIGVGTLASRPASCIKGVVYWATDTEILYKCTETNTWVPYYTPYPYPHPLRDKI